MGALVSTQYAALKATSAKPTEAVLPALSRSVTPLPKRKLLPAMAMPSASAAPTGMVNLKNKALVPEPLS